MGRDSNFCKWPINFVSGSVDIEPSVCNLLPLAHGSLRNGYVLTSILESIFRNRSITYQYLKSRGVGKAHYWRGGVLKPLA